MEYMIKTKTLHSLDKKIEQVSGDSLRIHILECAKEFKASWITLAQALTSVWKDKSYKTWGFLTFDAYVSKELKIRKQTAMKLLGSYSFLEKEAPQYVQEGYYDEDPQRVVPLYESVDILRKTKEKGALQEDEYSTIKRDVLEKGKDAREIKQDLAGLIRKREEHDPQEEKRKQKIQKVRQMLSALKTIKRDAEILRLLPGHILSKTQELIQKIEEEILLAEAKEREK